MDTVLAGLETGAIDEAARCDGTPSSDPSNDNEQGFDVRRWRTPRLIRNPDFEEAIGC